MRVYKYASRAMLLVGLGLLAACSGLPGFGGGIPATPTGTAEVTATVEVTPAPTAASCPGPIGDEQLYEEPSLGFCFLYPRDFYLFASSAVIFHGPPHGSGVEQGVGAMSITVSGLGGQSLQEYADRAAALASPGDQPTQQKILFGSGYSGILIDNTAALPGWRDVLLEHGGQVYQISFQPWSAGEPEARADLERIFSTVSASWTFTKP
jgi:hypothetical protein